MRSHAAIAALALTAAGCSAAAERAEPTPAATTSAPVLQSGDAERQVVTASSGRIRRVGDTLFVRTASGAESTYVDNPADNDTYVKYTYRGAIAGGALHELDVQGWEWSNTLLVNAASGQRLRIVGAPVVSPDGRRLAASQAAMESCEGVTRLEIFRMTDSVPAPEWGVEPFDCMTATGWSASELKWRSADTLQFTRNELPPPAQRGAGPEGATVYVTRPMLAVRAGATWRIVAPR